LAFDEQVHDRGFRVIRLELAGSTNDEALTAARSGDPGRLWILAKAQTRGRGRHGREWVSPPGNLYASLLLIEASPREKAPELGFVIGVALARTLRAILSGDPRLKIKWPNDILYDGAKLAGILLESTVLSDGRFASVAGIGVNCRSHPETVLYPATNLFGVTGSVAAPEAVFAQLAEATAYWLDIWAHGAGFERIRAEWLSLAAGLGDRIQVGRASETLEGIFETIDPTGRLVLATSSGRTLIEAADVFLAAHREPGGGPRKEVAP
jgi:BirA family biotin operon repressor/biotin-[acetyl-CoA-carboxylase] ligase